MEQMAPPLLKTKLFRPQAPANLVSRAHLFSRLDKGLHTPLTLISAPPGFGKTTLLADWAERNAVQDRALLAWLSLDLLDNEPHHFLTYLVTALDRVQGSIGREGGAGGAGGAGGTATEALAALRAMPPAPASTVLTLLINGLEETTDPVVLVLDDYHFIASAAVHEAVTFLLEHMPSNMHLVICTRADPPLPLPRLRARGQMVEIRADDLRFSAEEVCDFLNRVMDLRLSPEEIEKLDERTEGWIAGLQMAALSILGRPDKQDRSDFIQAFSGSNRYILDYLAEEVLSRQPDRVQHFLLHTSILDRLCAPLCDAILEIKGSSDTADCSSQTTLEMLERANLFLMPQDEERHWYRYHHLFADLLQARLARTDPRSMPELHRRAAAWLEEQGLLAEAIAHWLAAGDGPRAGLLVQRNWRQVVADGSPATALAWIEALPEDVVRPNPILGVAFCWLLLMTGHTATVEERLEIATLALSRMQAEGTVPPEDPDYVALPALLACVRATMARHHGNLREAIEQGRQAVAFGEKAGAWEQAVGWLMLGHSYRAVGQMAEAAEAYTRVISPARSSGQLLAETTALFYAAHIERLRGHLSRALHLCQEALGLPGDANGASKGAADGAAGGAGGAGSGTAFQVKAGRSTPPAWLRLPAYSLVHLAMAEVLCERNELEQAGEYLATAIELNLGGQEHQARVFALLAQARLRFARGDLAGSSSALDEAEIALRQLHIPLAEAELQVQRVRVWIAEGRMEAVAEWVREQQALLADLVNGTASADDQAPDDMTAHGLADASTAGLDLGVACYARVQIASRQLYPALQYLDRAQEGAERRGNRGAATEMSLAKAVAMQGLGRTQEALAALTPALELAASEGYMRLFLDEGAPVATLLRLGTERGIWQGERGQGPGGTQGYSQGYRKEHEVLDRHERFLDLDGYARHLLTAFDECDVPGDSISGQRPLRAHNGAAAQQTPDLAGTAGGTTYTGGNGGLVGIPTVHTIETLTPREAEVLGLIARGLSNQEIADQLIVAVGTVKAQVHSICGKLDARNRVEALAHARDLRLIR